MSTTAAYQMRDVIQRVAGYDHPRDVRSTPGAAFGRRRRKTATTKPQQEWWRRVYGPEGFALVATLGTLIVLTILSITGMQVAMSNQQAATTSQDRAAATSLAESGVNLGVDQLVSSGGVAGGTQPIDSGSTTWTGKYEVDGWHLFATGTVHGASASTEAVLIAGKLTWLR